MLVASDIWTKGDLELGQLSVRHGPLNWLHEARHVIGTIADTRMVLRDEQMAMDLDQPYIHATSAIWKWIYPDEAMVIEQASEQNKLWYSMECVSKEVACVGDNGCGAKAAYGAYLKGEGGSCEHMRQLSPTRHFADSAAQSSCPWCGRAGLRAYTRTAATQPAAERKVALPVPQ